MPTIRLPDDTRLYYRVHDDAPPGAMPLVLVHGAGGTHMHWPAELRRLAGATVYSLDLPGHGHSPGPARGAIGEYAAVIRAFADALRLPRFILAGHSMGGAIALECALTAAARLAGLVLVATGARLPVAPQILTGLLADFAGTTDRLAAWMHAEDTDPALLEEYARRLRETPREVLYGDFVACDRFDRLADLPEITVPAVVICGEADRMTPLRYSQTLAGQLPHAQLAVITAAGHMVMLERPAEVTAAVAGWMTTLSPGAQAGAG